MTYHVTQIRDGRQIERDVTSAKEAGTVGQAWRSYGEVWIITPAGDRFELTQFQERVVDAVKYRNGNAG